MKVKPLDYSIDATIYNFINGIIMDVVTISTCAARARGYWR